MDCRAFHHHHLAFVDDTLPAVDMVAMQAHLGECEACAAHDALVRRSLMLLRNLPPIEPSPGFTARLNARLQAMGPVDVVGASRLHGTGGPGIRGFVAAAVGVVAFGYLTASAFDWTGPAHPLRMAPVIASAPEPPPPPLASPAFMASVSMGMPVWPAAIMAEQAPVHFARSEFRLTSLPAR